MEVGEGDARSADYRGQVYLIIHGVYVNIYVIYSKIVAMTFSAEGRVCKERKRGRDGAEYLGARTRLKTLKDSVIYHGRLPAGMEKGKGYNPPDRLIAD